MPIIISPENLSAPLSAEILASAVAPEAGAASEPGPAEAAALRTGEAADEAAGETATAAVFDVPGAAAPAVTEPPLPPPDAAHATLRHGLQALQRPESRPESPPESPPATPPATPFALADDLHYRLIQYARFAAPLVAAQQQAIGLVYAADWPTWLAALEMRYRCRCPLVLHLARLAAHEAAPAERGWLLELERYALRRAHTVLVASDALRQQVQAAYPTLLARVLVVDVTDAAALVAVFDEVTRVFNPRVGP